jgi:hypothetical protein
VQAGSKRMVGAGKVEQAMPVLPRGELKWKQRYPFSM